ncbi:MAG: porphobilinogen synthase [Legionellales bacterium]|jgi:porphobilinogen synthase
MSHFNVNRAPFPLTRMRRNRGQAFVRDFVQENQLHISDLLYPIFVTANSTRESIASMPGIERIPLNELAQEVQEIQSLGIRAVALFPSSEHEKSADAKAAYNPEGLIQRAVKLIKQTCPDLGVMTDGALDPYTLSGQDGLTNSIGEVLNDETIAVLVKQALSHAKAGNDIFAPSDMMDGRIGAVRKALDEAGYPHIILLAYSAKYASNFYGPFRDAVGSSSHLGKQNKLTYQMNPANSDEALHEVALDLQEGADLVMIKPGLPYLDIVARVKETFKMPTVVYQVSGEYAMIKAASEKKYLDERLAVMETMIAFKRAGADIIITYFAKDIAKWLKDKS